MKTKLTPKAGRKKFSAGKQIDPSRSAAENVMIAAVGEFTSEPEKKRCFRILNSLVPVFLSKYFGKQDKAIWEVRRQKLAWDLFDLFFPAIANHDPKPFRNFAEAIEMHKELFSDGSGVLLRDTHEVLRVVIEMDLTTGENVIQKIKPSDFKAKLRWEIDERQFARIRKQIGLHFPTGRPPKG